MTESVPLALRSGAGYNLDEEGRMMGSSVHSWAPGPPCVYTKLQKELVVECGALFEIHRTFEAELPSDATCSGDEPTDVTLDCVGMAVYRSN